MTRTLPDPPALPGITWRPARRDDAAAIVSLQDTCFALDGGYREVESEILDRWESDYCTAQEDSLVAVKSDGGIVAVAWVYVPTIATAKWRAFHDNYVHPDYRTTEAPEFVFQWWRRVAGSGSGPRMIGYPATCGRLCTTGRETRSSSLSLMDTAR